MGVDAAYGWWVNSPSCLIQTGDKEQRIITRKKLRCAARCWLKLLYKKWMKWDLASYKGIISWAIIRGKELSGSHFLILFSLGDGYLVCLHCNKKLPSGKLTWLPGKWTCWRCIPYWPWGFSIATLFLFHFLRMILAVFGATMKLINWFELPNIFSGPNDYPGYPQIIINCTLTTRGLWFK